MRYSWILILPLLGGCMSNLHAEIPPPAAPPLTSTVTAVEEVQASAATMVETGGSDLPMFKPDFDNIFADQSGTPYSLLEFDHLFSAGEDEVAAGETTEEDIADADGEETAEEEAIVEIEDPDALTDNLLLSTLEENPPQDEGATIPADEAREITFDFPVVENEKVHYYVDYFSGPAKKVFTRWLERSARYLPLMQQIFVEEGLPRDLVYLAMVESGFNNRAYSWAHAAGPWQFIASTGRLFGMDVDWWRDERRDFEKATRGAARFLRELKDMFGGDWYLALAGYNAGPGKVQRAIEMYNSRDFWEISRHSYLATETKNYVPKLLATLLIAKQPEKYGFTEVNYKPPVAYEVVTLPDATDLEIVAKFCNVSYEEIRDLNPELNRWCTPPTLKEYPLRIPAGKKEDFERRYAELPPAERANYETHHVRQGETLKGLAKKYRVRADDILAMNGLASPRSLRAGSELILPLRKGSPIPARELASAPTEGRKKTYTVRKGDTLRSIGRKFHVSEKELRRWNRITNVRRLKPGQVLTVSAKGVKAVAESQVSNVVYKVRKGDTLSGIARRHGVSVDQILEWNGLSRRQVLRPGEKLTLAQTKAAGKTKSAVVKTSSAKSSAKAATVAKNAAAGKKKITYKVRPGDTLWAISRKFDVATDQIIKWNKLAGKEVLQPGVKLTLMVDAGKAG